MMDRATTHFGECLKFEFTSSLANRSSREGTKRAA
jgi:hypothetical protein